MSSQSVILLSPVKSWFSLNKEYAKIKHCLQKKKYFAQLNVMDFFTGISIITNYGLWYFGQMHVLNGLNAYIIFFNIQCFNSQGVN